MHLCPGEKSVIYYIILKKPIHSVRQNGSQLYVLTSKEEGKRTDVPKIIRTIIRITCLGNTRARARARTSLFFSLNPNLFWPHSSSLFWEGRPGEKTLKKRIFCRRCFLFPTSCLLDFMCLTFLAACCLFAFLTLPAAVYA